MSQIALSSSALPSFHTSFLGRERELAGVRSLLLNSNVRLVTVVGIGGVGKTRFALELARLAAEDFDGAVYFVPLAAVNNDQQILELIARAIGISVSDERALPAAIASALDRGPAILILDNFEHLLDQSVAIGRLLSNDTNLRILITSRSPLDIRGEHVFHLEPFPIPSNAELLPPDELRELEAIRLFEERARAVQHDFRVGSGNAYAVVEICRRLDGLPLAVELAAARSRLLSPSVLLARLDRPLEALGSGPRDSPDRHQSLRAALDWSYDLLPPAEQQLYLRLGAPRGSFSIAAIEALCEGIDLDPLEGISSLVSKSLVQPSNVLRSDGTESVRFQMLVTVREFALERLAATLDFVEAHNLFARHIGRLAETVTPEFPFGPARGESSFDITGVDREPVLGALDWLHRSGQPAELLHLTGLLAPHWFARGALRDAQSALQLALTLKSDANPTDRARATVALGMVAIQQGNFEYGEQQLQAGLDLVEDAGADSWIGQANFSMGVVKQDRGLPLEAIPYFEEAHRNFIATQQSVFAIIALNNLGLVTARGRDPRAGLAIIEDARKAHQQLGFLFGAALADRYAGQILLQIGETEHARRVLRASLQLAPEHMQGWHVANSVETLAMLDANEGDLRRAATLGAGAMRIREEIGVPLEPALASQWAAFQESLRVGLVEQEHAQVIAIGRDLSMAKLIGLAIEVPEPDSGTAGLVSPTQQSGDFPPLTAREMDVLELLVDGRTNSEIGNMLYISPRTVSVHVTHILGKLNVENRSAAVALALRSGVIQPRF